MPESCAPVWQTLEHIGASVTPHQILIVGIRLLAIFWFLSILGQIAAAFAALEQMGAATLPIWISAGIQLAACVFLWFFPATLASKLLRGGNSTVLAGSVPFHEWRDLLIVTVGIFVLARSIPSAVYWAILAGASDAFTSGFTLEQKVNAFAALLELLIGTGLIFGARGLGSLIQHLRNAGLPSSRSGAQQ
jgi:hypothetical protein